MEQKILGGMIASREMWSTIIPHIEAKEFSPEGALILEKINEYYNTDGQAGQVDRDILAARIERSVQSNKLSKALIGILRNLPSDVSGINLVREVLGLKAHNTGLRLAARLAAGKHDDETSRLMGEYNELALKDGFTKEEEEDYQNVSITELLAKHFDRSKLIQIWPPELNNQLDGGAKPGHHVLVFAPTEMGKTLFVLNMVAGFLKQNLKVLYVGNEDTPPDIIMRLASRLTGMTKHEIEADPKRAEEILARRNWGNFILSSLAPGTFPQINRLVDTYKPVVVILDQLGNISVTSDNAVAGLERAAKDARALAKKRKVLVVSVAQAADSASGKRYLDRGDVHNSNIGIPGQIDLMIGLGADAEMEGRNLRVISLAKNKLSGDHTPITITIDPTLSKVVSP